MKVIIGNASKELGELIVNELSIQPFPSRVSKFADGEINVEVANDLYNKEIYIVQSISFPVNDRAYRASPYN